MEGLRGLNCGVFVAVTTGANISTRGSDRLTSSEMNNTSVYDATSTSSSIATGRISYVFDLEGPNSAFDTACSSSLVALHAAISSLKQGECKVALVIAVNQLFDSSFFASCAKAGMLSPSGQCHTWDASADGYLRGEGCGAIVLQPFDAEASSGNVYANILGTSVQSDGKSASITAPNGLAQERLIQKALKMSNIKPGDVDYIEAHGTGTALGDPIEMEALAGVFAESFDRSSLSHSLMVGGVKSNIGHLEMAAGMAGLIKAILVLGQEYVPPNVGLKKLNPHIEESIESHNFAVELPTVLAPLHTMSGKDETELLVAGVSSFGYSGTITHAVICQAPQSCRRKVMIDADHSIGYNNIYDILFLFTGQGSQYPGMGKQLYEDDGVFRSSMDQCNDIYRRLNTGHDILELIFSVSKEELSKTNNAQPALVALEWCLAMRFQSDGICPTAVLGHSVGEITAACIAGAMSIETALELAIKRGEMMWALPQMDGVMVAVLCSLTEAVTAIAACLSDNEQEMVGVGSVNGPQSIVLSGTHNVV